jgi:hypothetical protein
MVAWWARAGIIAVACGLAWYTWAHWGDFQVDCGREIYVPATLLQGKLLFRDVWYTYGPLAPYVQALLFLIFGVHLTVLYLFGLGLTISSALLTFEIAREFRLGVAVSCVPSLFFLSEAFHPFIFNFVYPYSYAASVSACLGLACLYFVTRHARTMRTFDLALAAVIAGLVVLTKQEFGLACLVLLGFEVAASNLVRRSTRALLGSLGICCAGLAPAMAVYAWFIWKTSAKTIFLDNWIPTPGTYFMRTFAKYSMAAQGFRFIPSEILESAAFLLLVVMLWFTLAWLDVLVIKKLRLHSRLSILGLVATNLVPVAILLKIGWSARLIAPFIRSIPRVVDPFAILNAAQYVLTQAVLPHGIYFVGAFFFVQALWRLIKSGEFAQGIQECCLSVYALLIGIREMMGNSAYTALFFNVPLFLIFVILLHRIIGSASRELEPKRRNFLAGSMLSAEAALLFVMLFPNPGASPEPLTTEYGTLYTRPDVAILFPQIIAFMKTHTKNGKDILVVPEPPSLYVFAGMQSPSKWYSLVPGVVPPEHEPEFLRELVANQVRYVLIVDRTMSEYGPVRFGYDYDELIYRWINEHYVKVGQFGPLPNQPVPPYVLWIYGRNDADGALGVSQIDRSGSLSEAAEHGEVYGSR